MSVYTLMYKVTIRLWAAFWVVFLPKVTKSSSVLRSKENFYQRHTQETTVKGGFPHCRSFRYGRNSHINISMPERKGIDDLSLAYGETNKQHRFSRKLFQELPSAVQHRCNLIQMHADLLQQVGAHLYSSFLWVTFYTQTHPGMEFFMHRNRLFL